MSTIVKVGSASTGRDFPGPIEAIAAIPADITATSGDYILEFYPDSEFVITGLMKITGKITDASHRIILRAAAGLGYRTMTNAVANALRYNPTNGVAIKSTSSYTDMLTIDNDYVVIDGLQMQHLTINGSSGIGVPAGRVGVIIDGVVMDYHPNNNASAFYSPSSKVQNATIILHNDSSRGVNFDYGTSGSAENVTVLRAAGAPVTGAAFLASGGGSANVKVVNCAAFGMSNFIVGAIPPDNCHNNATDLATLGVGTGLTSLVYADQFVSNDATAGLDLRTKDGSALINAGAAPSAGNINAAVGPRQQGTSADIGSWEHPEAVQAPSATVTNIAVDSGTGNVTVSGTTTGFPTSGNASLAVSNVPYNSGVAQGPAALTIGSGTFSVTFNAVLAGRYSVSLQVANSAYTVAGQNTLGDFTVDGPHALSVVQNPVDGQILTIHGTTTGTPTSATLYIPADTTTPAGAVDVQATVTLGVGSFTSSATLQPGNYGAGILRFTSAAGTSLPQAGTAPVKVVGIYGSPQADQGTPDITAPVLGGALTITNVTSSGFTMGWQAATDDVGVARYEYSLGNNTWLPAGSGTGYAVTGVESDTSYAPLLRAVDFGGNVSNTITGTTKTLAASASSSRSITLSLVMSASLVPLVPAANLSNLRWAWFDQAVPNLFAAPTDHGTVESTDANGVLTIPLPNSTLSAGGIGWLIITDSTGNPALASNAFSAPVMVD